VVGVGDSGAEFQTVQKEDVGCWEAQTGFARSGTGWVLELSLLIRQWMHLSRISINFWGMYLHWLYSIVDGHPWQWTDCIVHGDHKHCWFFKGCERFYRTIRELDVLMQWVNHEIEQGKLKLIHVVEDHKKRVPDACSQKQAKTFSSRWLTTDSLQIININQSSSTY
jgi:hypothetical protein